MITGDLVKHKIDPNSFGVIMKVGALGAKVLWRAILKVNW
jgi:hypothetical protein